MVVDAVLEPHPPTSGLADALAARWRQPAAGACVTILEARSGDQVSEIRTGNFTVTDLVELALLGFAADVREAVRAMPDDRLNRLSRVAREVVSAAEAEILRR
jgi:hypothetical protein